MKYFILTDLNLHIDIKGHAILFEEIKRGHSAQQIHFIGVPFIGMGMKRLDCGHDIDRCASSKKKRTKNEIKQVKVFSICLMVS